MELYPEWKELFESFDARGVEYLVVGGHALAFHGAPRFTGDLDILVRPTEANAHRVILALKDFGFDFPNLTAEDFMELESVVQLGRPPVRVDLLTSLSGVTWEEANLGKTPGKFGELTVNFLGRTDLIRTKRATGRRQDLADIEALGG